MNIYIYSGLAIALSLVAYVVITNKKKPTPTEQVSEEELEAEDVVVTPVGDVITTEQANLDPTLAEILKLPLAEIKLKTVSMSLIQMLPAISTA